MSDSYVRYHYCSFETFESMIQSKCLWLTDLTESNDTEEFIRLLDIMWQKIRDKIPSRATDIDEDVVYETIRICDTQIKLQTNFIHPYGTCFCAEPDLVNLWNEYGARGEGVSLGFDLTWFGIHNDMPTTSSNIQRAIGYADVIYETGDYEEAFISMCCMAMRDYGYQAWFKGILPTFKQYAGFFKNPSFKAEQETRIVYYPIENSQNALPGLSGLIEKPIKHCCLWWKNGSSSALRSITIGTNCTHSPEEVKRLLIQNGILDAISIKESYNSYRY